MGATAEHYECVVITSGYLTQKLIGWTTIEPLIAEKENIGCGHEITIVGIVDIP